MQRILFLHQSSSVGGGSYCLLNIIKTLDTNCYKPIVALKSYGPLVEELSNLDVEVVLFTKMSFFPYNRPIYKVGSILAYIRLLSSQRAFNTILNTSKPDIVYFNNMMLAGYLKVAKKFGAKTICHVREHWPSNEHILQLGFIRKFVNIYSDRIIAINGYSSSIFPKKKATIVYDWINMEKRFEYMPLEQIFNENMTGKRVFLFTGGTQIIKGALEVIKAFSTYRTSAEDRLLLVGVPPLSSQNKLINYFNRGKHYMGDIYFAISKDDRIKCMPSVFNLSHIIKQSYCNLSYFTIPHANLAMAECITLGIPSIAAQTDESLEYSCNGKLAMLYPINNFSAFCEKLVRLDNEYSELKARIDKESNKITELFDENANILRLQSVIKSLS